VAAQLLLKTGQDILPVIDRKTKVVAGAISATNILKAYQKRHQHDTHRNQNITTRRNLLKVFSKGRQLFVK
jgi:hypothetical protein